MIGPYTKVPIRVGDDGNAGPYIIIQLDQLDRVTKVLDDAGIRYKADAHAVSLNGQPYSAVVNLGHRVDVPAVQKLLDQRSEPKPDQAGSIRRGQRG